jgi:hypothetical protein
MGIEILSLVRAGAVGESLASVVPEIAPAQNSVLDKFLTGGKTIGNQMVRPSNAVTVSALKSPTKE